MFEDTKDAARELYNLMFQYGWYTIEEAEEQKITIEDKFIAAGQAITAFASIVSTLKGTWETIKDPDLSAWERFTAIISAAGTVATTLTFALNETTIGMLSSTGASIASAIGFNTAAIGAEGLNIAGITLKKTFIEVTIAFLAIAFVEKVFPSPVFPVNRRFYWLELSKSSINFCDNL